MWPHRQQSTRLPCPWDSPGKNTGVGCHFLLQCMKVKSEREVAQSCPTFHNPMDCSPPGSSAHGIFQARVMEWGAITFSSEIKIVVLKIMDSQPQELEGTWKLNCINPLWLKVRKVSQPPKQRGLRGGNSWSEAGPGLWSPRLAWVLWCHCLPWPSLLLFFPQTQHTHLL